MRASALPSRLVERFTREAKHADLLRDIDSMVVHDMLQITAISRHTLWCLMDRNGLLEGREFRRVQGKNRIYLIRIA